MYGGLLKSASALAILAAAGLYGISPASAADLGGDCCADLEERVAELEATTARKGTRKVSLTISGHISQELLFWDDGIRDDMYVTGNNASNSRWRMAGSAKISPEWSAGFLYEFQFYASNNASVNQGNAGDDAGNAGLGIVPNTGQTLLREANVWIEHSRLGRVTIGQGNTASTNSMLVDLSGKSMGSSNYIALHAGGMVLNNGAAYGTATWAHFISGRTDWLNGRHEAIQYRTPTIAGFTLGASVGEDNFWDVALRYAGEFNGIRIAGAVSYAVLSEYNGPIPDGTGTGAAILDCVDNCEKKVKQWTGSLSIRHMPTGLFFTGAAGTRDIDDQDASGPAGNFSADFWYASAGIARNFFGIGDTVLFGEYGVYSGAGIERYAGTAGADMEHWGVGITQHVDAAALELYVTYKNLSLSGIGAGAPAAIPAGSIEDYHMISVGTRIRF